MFCSPTRAELFLFFWRKKLLLLRIILERELKAESVEDCDRDKRADFSQFLSFLSLSELIFPLNSHKHTKLSTLLDVESPLTQQAGELYHYNTFSSNLKLSDLLGWL